MKTKFLIQLAIVAIFLMASCDSFHTCIKGNNRIAKENRSVGEFSGVFSYGSFLVEIYNSENFSLEIETDENLLQYIESYIQGNNLILETKRDRCIRSTEPIKVIVGTPFINTIKLAGSGDIYCEQIDAAKVKLELMGSGNLECNDIKADEIEARLLGSGDMDLSGFSDIADFLISGSGNINAINLVLNSCYADITGSGNIYIWANEYLDVNIAGSGNLYYKGEPEIITKYTGSGRVYKYQ